MIGGCDIGSATGKAVVMNNHSILSYAIIPSTTKPEVTARTAMDHALEQAGLSSSDDLEYVVGTGYGRLKVPFANENISEITCHARGAHWMSPTVRTVVDIGGQDCKVISLDERDKVVEFVMNDRCAAGTGRFFEAMARVLGLDLEGLSSLALEGKSPATITSQCSVFSESEVVTLVNEGMDLADIAAGLHVAIATRLTSMIGRVGLTEDVALTGGCDKNAGLAKALEDKLQVQVVRLPSDHQMVGAVGAALIGIEKLNGGSRK